MTERTPVDVSSPLRVHLALALCGGGIGMIAMAWGRVAGRRTVAEQLPDLIGWGLGGMALVVVGAALLAITVAQRDAAMRIRQQAELATELRAIHEAIADGGGAA